jgi:hypothetical protein
MVIGPFPGWMLGKEWIKSYREPLRNNLAILFFETGLI